MEKQNNLFYIMIFAISVIALLLGYAATPKNCVNPPVSETDNE